MKRVQLYTDGSCLFNNKDSEFSPGGWCYILRYKNIEKVQAGFKEKTTNNRMEMTAVIKGLESLTEKCDVDFYSDSTYVLKGMEEYLINWKKNNRLVENDVKNPDLWIRIDELLNEKVNNANYIWVKGHNQEKINDEDLEFARQQNHRCDLLAREKATEVYNRLK